MSFEGLIVRKILLIFRKAFMFDSVELICSGTGDFSWQGPNGSIPTNASSIYVTTPGYYFCIRDDNICNLNSNNLEVFQYNTPLLITIGTGTVCNNNPVTMQIITGVGSVVNWDPPLTGQSLTQTVTIPGTYTCTVTSCNINTPLGLTVPGSNPIANITYSSLSVCDGDTIHLQSDSAKHYEWLPPGDSSSSINVFTSGIYTLNTIDSLDCPATDAVSLNFYQNFLQTPVTIDTTICNGENIILSASGNNFMRWNDEQSNLVATGFTYFPVELMNTTYFILYSDSGGCRSEMDTLHVTINNCDTLFIPNVITPNGDGLNDFFPGKSEKGILFSIKIYNRCGRLVYDSYNAIDSWDGKNNSGGQLSNGTYYFVLEAKFRNGKVQRANGWVEVFN